MHLSDDTEACNNEPNNESDSDSHECDFDDADSEWADMTENNNNQPQTNFGQNVWREWKLHALS
jgi:hypothetical protein